MPEILQNNRTSRHEQKSYKWSLWISLQIIELDTPRMEMEYSFKIRGSVISKRNLEMILSSQLPLFPPAKNFISCRFWLGDNAEKPLFSHVNFYCGNVQLMKRKLRIPQGVIGVPRVLKLPKGVLIFNLVGWF